ncbi:MAG: hypothetical protein ACPG7W_06685 [Paracoccaceae bacterium]
MFLELIATIFAGIAGAGIVLALNKLAGGRLPRWLAPVMAGAAMLAATISNEYSWYSRTSAALPDGIVVAQTVPSQALYRPWTYVVPYTSRFMAVDVGGARQNAQDSNLLMADVYLYGRWKPLQSVQVMVNCTTGQRADPMADGGEPVWRSTPADDAVVTSLCAG